VTDAAPLVSAMDEAGLRLTAPRRALAELIADEPGHFTSAELADRARQRHVDVGRATIFRTLEVLSELGVIERIDLPSGEHAYVGCAPSHHHHVVCSRCGRTAEIADAGLRTMAREAERRTGFRIDEHRVEFFGRCPDCMDLD
jgi:Fur family transcriptional regulator, ferric uptake regulator